MCFERGWDATSRQKNGVLSELVWSKGARHPSALTNTPEDDRRVNDKVQELFLSLVSLHAKRLQMQVIRNNSQSMLPGPVYPLHTK